MLTNKLISEFLKNQKDAVFINVWHAMLTPDEEIKEDLFLEDNLHMASIGYTIWQRLIGPYLIND